MSQKPTTLQEDLISLKELYTGDSSKGFSSKGSKTNIDNNEIDPSGMFKNSKISAITFCIQKKKLLLEAAKFQ